MKVVDVNLVKITPLNIKSLIKAQIYIKQNFSKGKLTEQVFVAYVGWFIKRSCWPYLKPN